MLYRYVIDPTRNLKVTSLFTHIVDPEPLSFSTLTATDVAFLARPHVFDITVPGEEEEGGRLEDIMLKN